MAGKSNARKLRELLTEKADWLLEQIAACKDIGEMCKELGVFPGQVAKFFTNMPEYRDRYKQALITAKELQAEVKAKASKKVKGFGKPRTQAEIIAMFEQEILDAIAEGKLLREISRHLEVDYAAISKHFHKGGDDLLARYEAAKEEGGHALAEAAVEVTNEPALDLVDAKVMETRSNRLAWLAAKRNKQYDQRQQLDVKGQMVHSVSIDISA